MRIHRTLASRFTFALVLVPFGVATAVAAVRRPPVRIDYVPSSRIDEIRSFAKAMNTGGGTVANAWDLQTSYMLVRRTTESDVEEHSRWDDVILVRAGNGAVIFGPRAKGARAVAAGELRGGALVTRESRVLHPGDIARVPAGVPHAFIPAPGEPWELLIVKVRQGEKPLRRSAD